MEIKSFFFKNLGMFSNLIQKPSNLFKWAKAWTVGDQGAGGAVGDQEAMAVAPPGVSPWRRSDS